jgi:hypothetical protein
MKTYERVEVQLHAFLTSALHGVSLPGLFIPEREALVTTVYEAGWASDLVWTRLGRKKSLFLLETEPRSSSP